MCLFPAVNGTCNIFILSLNFDEIVVDKKILDENLMNT